MYVRKEALLSSQIEGTQATLDDILDPEAEDNLNINIADVLNYIKATDYALERMGELPLCLRLLRESHAILLSGNRGGENNRVNLDEVKIGLALPVVPLEQQPLFHRQ